MVTKGTHNLLFWTSPVFPEGSHQLVVTVDQDTSTNVLNRTFFLDYFVYQTTSAAGKTVLFDDTDASLTYSQGWQAINDSDSSLEGTQHLSESVGSSVALSFEGALPDSSRSTQLTARFFRDTDITFRGPLPAADTVQRIRRHRWIPFWGNNRGEKPEPTLSVRCPVSWAPHHKCHCPSRQFNDN